MKLILSFFLFFLVFFNIYSCFSQANLKPCYVGEDKYLCANNVSLNTNSIKTGIWKKSLFSSLKIDDVNSTSINVSEISRPIDTLIWINTDNSCTDTILLITPKIGTTQFTFFGSGKVTNNEITLCYGDSWFASTNLTQGVSNVAYVLYKSEPSITVDIYNDVEAYHGPVILANNDINDGSLISRYPNNNQEYWFVPILFHTINAQGPVIDPTCQIAGTPFKVKYSNKISITKVEDCMLGTSELTINGGNPQFYGGYYNIHSFLPLTASLNKQQLLLGEKLKISLLNPGDLYSFSIQDDQGCEQKFAEKFLPCPACKTDVIYQKNYCITEDYAYPQLKNGSGIGKLSVNKLGLKFDSISGKLDIKNSIPGVYILKNESSDICPLKVETNFTIDIKDIIPLPIGPSIDTVCIANPKVGDIKGVSGQFIRWYDINSVLLNPLHDPIANDISYFCTQTIDGCESEKLQIKIFAPTVAPPIGSLVQYICPSELNPTISNLQPHGATIIWYDNNGNKLKTIDKLKEGIYYASQFLGCESFQKLKINVVSDKQHSPIDFSDYDSLYYCFGNKLIIDSLFPSGNEYKWYDLPNSKTELSNNIELEQGTYYVSYINGMTKCESLKNKVRVFIVKTQPKISVLEPTCGLKNGVIKVDYDGGFAPYEFKINDEVINSDKHIINSGIYYIRIKESSMKQCQFDTTLNVPCKELKISQLLTPNNDNNNDVWEIDFASTFSQVQVKIYNRWGDMVYESKVPYTDDWNGIANKGNSTGNQLPAGTYYYIIDKKNGEQPEVGYLELITK